MTTHAFTRFLGTALLAAAVTLPAVAADREAAQPAAASADTLPAKADTAKADTGSTVAKPPVEATARPGPRTRAEVKAEAWAAARSYKHEAYGHIQGN